MFLFDSKYSLHQSSRSRIVITEVNNHFAITVDCDSFGNKILLDHVDKRIPFDILGMTTRQKSFGIEVRFTLQLNNPVSNLVGVSLFFICVLQKLRGYALSVNSSSHEIMAFVSKHANDLRRQGLVEN